MAAPIPRKRPTAPKPRANPRLNAKASPSRAGKKSDKERVKNPNRTNTNSVDVLNPNRTADATLLQRLFTKYPDNYIPVRGGNLGTDYSISSNRWAPEPRRRPPVSPEEIAAAKVQAERTARMRANEIATRQRLGRRSPYYDMVDATNIALEEMGPDRLRKHWNARNARRQPEPAANIPANILSQIKKFFG